MGKGKFDRSVFEAASVGIPDYRGAKGSIIRLKIEDFMYVLLSLVMNRCKDDDVM